ASDPLYIPSLDEGYRVLENSEEKDEGFDMLVLAIGDDLMFGHMIVHYILHIEVGQQSIKGFAWDNSAGMKLENSFGCGEMVFSWD
ncbi:hypothetical protein HAX54_008052, partial [Datura stramonium]|nr:hypothetical protein [Datura stramonium]